MISLVIKNNLFINTIYKQLFNKHLIKLFTQKIPLVKKTVEATDGDVFVGRSMGEVLHTCLG